MQFRIKHLKAGTCDVYCVACAYFLTENAAWNKVGRSNQMVKSGRDAAAGCGCGKSMHDYIYGILCQQILETDGKSTIHFYALGSG